MRVTAISDVTGAVMNEKGLDVVALAKEVEKTGTVTTFREAEVIPPADLLTLKCDVLLPAAVASQITETNAGEVRARIIAEGAGVPAENAAECLAAADGTVKVAIVMARLGVTREDAERRLATAHGRVSEALKHG